LGALPTSSACPSWSVFTLFLPIRGPKDGANLSCGLDNGGRFILSRLPLAHKDYHQPARRFPVDKVKGVNPDTHLMLTFPSEPILGHSGQIRIYDAADDRLVDLLDLSIPPGPTTFVKAPASPSYTPIPYEYVSGHFTNANTKPGTPSGVALPTPDIYQLTIIGGFTDAFHFYPVIIHGNVATIYPHNNLLEYDKTYYVQIDPGVLTLSDGSFSGIVGKTGWTFTTKKTPPPADAERLVVCVDGTGDFNTVQGAVDFVPDKNPNRVTIFIKNGVYEEIVYFRNKTSITFLGEDRDKVIIQYTNNETFNPHPANIATNEVEGTFPSRRAAFAVDHSSGIHLVNFTVRSSAPHPGQAEGLLLVGGQNIVSNVTIEGSGDALQVNDSVYLTDCRIVGFGDNVLGRGPAFFERCDLVSYFGPHIWVRNTSANHGNVFLNCKFRIATDQRVLDQILPFLDRYALLNDKLRTTEGWETFVARAPTNHGKNYPYCEAVLINCALAGIRPEGWGDVGGDTSNVHYWEYNSTNISDGKPVDVSRRRPFSRQLTQEQDAEIIANYSDPTFVLGGWTPAMAPLILAQPTAVTAKAGQTAIFCVKAGAIPAATYQWLKDGTAIDGATNATLRIEHVGADDAAAYTVAVMNESGCVTSQAAALTVK
jgi:pectinesterase